MGKTRVETRTFRPFVVSGERRGKVSLREFSSSDEHANTWLFMAD